MKKFLLIMILLCLQAGLICAQQKDWQKRDIGQDTLFGISQYKAFAELLKGKSPKKIKVAILDTGIDTAHAELKGAIWTDSKIGIHGWNYIAGETGREDVTLLASYKKAFYDSLAYAQVPETELKRYAQHRMTTEALDYKLEAMRSLVADLAANGTEPARKLQKLAQYHLDHGLNGRNLEVDTAKGNPNVFPDAIAPLDKPNRTPIHGTHVAGIIAGKQYGIAPNAEIMMMKVNGNIREMRDKNVALSIRFAVDHGAKIINCSFGKPYTWNKKAVDEALRYAMSKDVLVIHAAGNDHTNLDEVPNYPNPEYLAGGKAQGWIEVGASDKKGEPLDFSSYGQTKVDLYAPGENIYSAVPGGTFEFQSGTSMATPVVAGAAAVLLGYFPHLSTLQVKEIIMKSIVKRESLKDKCVSGGIVNLYQAVKLAETYPVKK